MTKRFCLIALLAGSSIACFSAADPSPAQTIAQAALPTTPQRQKWRLQVLPHTGLPNAGGLSHPFSINNRDWVAGAINPPNECCDHPGLWRRTTDGQGTQTWRLTDLGTLGGVNAAVLSPVKNEIG
jgi:hypothetical protein